MSDWRPEKGLSVTQIDGRIDVILAEATLTEKVAMMSGHGFFAAYRADGGKWGARPYRAGGGIERLGIEPLYFTDGPRGVARGNSTCFPCTMARGASFDVDLERRIGEAMAIEIRAQGCTLSGAVCINLLRHPGWGRAQETYGEDPHHLGAMGTALGQGLQAHNVIATVKHFALNSMENTRFKVNVEIDERALHEVYLPHFKACIDGGIASVMSAYNQMNGEYCGQNRALLTDILRGEWGFTGFVHSDWIMGVYKPYGAAAGLDIENPEPLVFGEKLAKAVEDGSIEPQVIDTACRRILSTQYRFACAEDPLPAYTADMVASPAHAALALEAAEKSAVLLRNDGMLPLHRDTARTLAVLGKLAAIENTGDNGSSRVRARHVVTPLAGLSEYLGADAVSTADESDLEHAASTAALADAVIVVVGHTAADEGEFIPGDLTLGQDADDETVPDAVKAARKSAPPRPQSIGGDRADLSLKPEQCALIDVAIASGKPVAVIIITGSAVMVEGWHDRVGAIIQTFYAGQEGGTALASVVFGEVNPSGKLPFTVARNADDYPYFDKDAVQITYDLWHGYSKFDRDGAVPRYPFGHGLSYTHFSYRALRVRQAGQTLAVEVAVTNGGDRRGEDVVQVYVGPPGLAIERQAKLLRAFARVALGPGETRVVHLTIPVETLRWRDARTHSWQLETGTYRIFAGGASDAVIETEIIL